MPEFPNPTACMTSYFFFSIRVGLFHAMQGTKLMTMKLAKKDHQCMSIILEKNGLSIVQDVPINLVTPKNAARIQEVSCDDIRFPPYPVITPCGKPSHSNAWFSLVAFAPRARYEDRHRQRINRKNMQRH